MSPARIAAAIAFVLSVAMAITLTGPLLLFNPVFVAFEQARHGVPAAVGTDDGGVAHLTDAMLGDLFTNGDFRVSLDGSQPYLDAAERSHMSDVGGLVRNLVFLDLVALVGVALLGWVLRRERDLRGRLLLSGASAVALAAALLGIFFAVAFDAAFTAFHGLFFAAGSWQFPPGSHLITLFPEPFWYELALVAGGTIVVAALLAAVLGMRDLRSARSAPAAG